MAKSQKKAQESENKKNTQKKSEGTRISIRAQYIKDISFENPLAPESFRPSDKRPDIGISVDVSAKNLENNLYEVLIKIGVDAKRDGKTDFVLELLYAGIFVLQGIDEKDLDGALMVFCPNMLFPFARRVIADVSRDGGFPPLMLDPIDFSKLYLNKKNREKAEASKAKGKK